MSERIVSGYVRRAHGIRGEVVVRSLSDDPSRFAVGAVLQTDEDPPRMLTVTRSRTHTDGELLLFEGIDDRTTAEMLKGTSLTIAPEDRRTLDDDEFWPDQLIGLTAQSPEGVLLGRVTNVVLGEAQDRLVVESAGARVEVPFVDAIVGAVDVERGTIVVDAPEGLFPD